MPTKPAPRTKRPAPTARARPNRQSPLDPLPTWRNTRPRGNPEVDARDLERSRERLEMLLGR
jgi:hypothetical protein